MQYRFASILIFLVAIATLGAGCGNTTYVNEDGVTVKGNVRDGEYEITNEETGESAQVGIQKIPDNFPKDVPILEKTTIAMTTVSPESSALVLRTSKTVAETVAWYKEALAKEKWTISSEYSMPNIQIIDAKNSAGDTLAVLIGADEANTKKEGTTVTLTRTRAVETVETVTPEDAQE